MGKRSADQLIQHTHTFSHSLKHSHSPWVQFGLQHLAKGSFSMQTKANGNRTIEWVDNTLHLLLWSLGRYCGGDGLCWSTLGSETPAATQRAATSDATWTPVPSGAICSICQTPARHLHLQPSSSVLRLTPGADPPLAFTPPPPSSLPPSLHPGPRPQTLLWAAQGAERASEVGTSPLWV